MNIITKKVRTYPNFAQDMKYMDNLANAYATCTTNFRDVWKQKWYEMAAIIAKRASEWDKSVDKSRRN